MNRKKWGKQSNSEGGKRSNSVAGKEKYQSTRSDAYGKIIILWNNLIYPFPNI